MRDTEEIVREDQEIAAEEAAELAQDVEVEAEITSGPMNRAISAKLMEALTSGQREQTYRALQRRAEDLDKLSKKADDLGVETSSIEVAILQTKAAIDSILGQGNLFPQTPIEEVASEGPEDSERVKGDASGDGAGPYAVRQDANLESGDYEVYHTETGEIASGGFKDYGPAKQERDRLNAPVATEA